MTTTEAQQLDSGDKVGRDYHFGIVLRAMPEAVAIFWEDQKPREITTYSRNDTELRDVVLKRKAAEKTVGAQSNDVTNGDTLRSGCEIALPLVRSSKARQKQR